VNNNLTIPEKLQIADILVADAKLDAYILVLDENTKQFLEETNQKQEEILKLKEVNEECLRMVVQL
jgi:hypothetical protein